MMKKTSAATAVMKIASKQLDIPQCNTAFDIEVTNTIYVTSTRPTDAEQQTMQTGLVRKWRAIATPQCAANGACTNPEVLGYAPKDEGSFEPDNGKYRWSVTATFSTQCVV